MNMETIFDIVKKAMKEPSSSGHWTDAQLYDEANRAQNRVTALNPSMLDTKYTQTSSTDDQELVLATNLIEVVNVKFDKRKLWYTTMKDLDLESSYGNIEDQWTDWSGQPTRYYVRKNVIGLVPKVSAAYASKTIEIFAKQNMTDLASSTDVPFDNYTKYYPWHEMVIEHMLWKLKLADGDDGWQAHRNEFYVLDKSLKKFINEEPDELPNIPLVRGSYTQKPSKYYPLS